jgi:hypothetical protein
VLLLSLSNNVVAFPNDGACLRRLTMSPRVCLCRLCSDWSAFRVGVFVTDAVVAVKGYFSSGKSQQADVYVRLRTGPWEPPSPHPLPPPPFRPHPNPLLLKYDAPIPSLVPLAGLTCPPHSPVPCGWVGTRLVVSVGA